MKLRRGLLILAVAAVVIPGEGWSQVRQQQRRGQIERRIQARFGEVVREQLELSAEEQRMLGDIVRAFQPQRQEIAQSEIELRRRIVLPVSLEDEEAAVDLLTRMIEVREMELDLLRQEQEALLEILPAGKVARFFQLREALGNQVRQMRGRGGGGPGGVGAPGGRPGGVDGAFFRE